MVELETGDILIFASKGSYLSSLIKYFTQSQITHVGMVLKDPTWINPCLKGTFLWESGWEGTPDPQDNKLKLGVQITALEDVRKHFKNSRTASRPRACTNQLNKSRGSGPQVSSASGLLGA